MDFIKLKNKKNFCILPWSHLFIHSTGDVYPCCKLPGNKDFLIGNTSQSIEELWNSKVLKEMRLKMLNDIPIKACDDCCNCNIQSLKKHIEPDIYEFSKNSVESTTEDGSCNPNFIVWNVVESNKCNFRCSYCTHDYSNSWYIDYEKITGNKLETNKIQFAYDSLKTLKNEFIKYIDVVKNIYMAAGESTFQDGYYWMLQELIKRNRQTQVSIFFITNLSSFVYKNKNIYELLNEFKNVKLFASLDAMESKAEYIRYGTNWKLIENNRKELLNYKNIEFYLQPVMTNMNLYSFPDFHYDWYNKGFVKKDNVRYYVLSSPTYFKVNVLPDGLKNAITLKYIKYKEWLSDCVDTYANQCHPLEKIEVILNEMNRPTDQLTKFSNIITTMDSVRNISFKESFKDEYNFFRY